jgi:hypothetical protein
MSSVGDNHTFSVGDFLIAGGLYSVTALRENAREITRDKESVFAMSDEGRGMTSKNMSDAHQGARRWRSKVPGNNEQGQGSRLRSQW